LGRWLKAAILEELAQDSQKIKSFEPVVG